MLRGRGDQRRAAPPGTWSHAGFAEVAAALARHAGLQVPPHRFPDLEEHARKAMRRAGLDDPRAYAEQLGAGLLPLADLVADFTVGETYFFRDLPQFEVLRGRVLPELLSGRPPGHRLRAWSAGCASGEEAWSLALALERAAPAGGFGVLGTDISRPALARARAAVYGEWSLRGPGRPLALEGLVSRGDRWEVDARLRPLVRFEYLNLAEEGYPSVVSATNGLDLVLCRNVLIYFERSVVEAVARRLFAALAPGGWLLTGLADPPLGKLAPLEPLTTEAGVLYRRPAAGLPRPPPPRPPAPSPAPPIASPPPGALPVARAPAPPAPARPALPAPGGPASGAPAPGEPVEAPLAAALEAARAGDWGAVLARQGPLLGSVEGAALVVRAAANAGALEVADGLSEQATARHALAPELHLLRAVVLSERGRTGEALEALRRVLYLDRGLAVGHLAMAGLLARAGDVPGARRAWRNVQRLCAARPPEEPVPLSDGQCAGRLAAVASAQLSLLEGGGDGGSDA